MLTGRTRSIYAKVDIPAGAVITKDMLKCVRPEAILLPEHMSSILGATTKKVISKDDPITWEMI